MDIVFRLGFHPEAVPLTKPEENITQRMNKGK